MRTMSLLLLLLLAPRRRLSRNTRPSFLRRRRRFVFAPFFFFFFFFVCLFSIHYFSLSLFTLCTSFLCFFKTLNGTVVKKRNKNFFENFSSIYFCFLYLSFVRVVVRYTSTLLVYTIVQSRPSWKVVAEDGGRRRASGAFFATKGASETTGPKTLFGWKN